MTTTRCSGARWLTRAPSDSSAPGAISMLAPWSVSVAGTLPGHLAGAGALVRDAREHEEQVGEAVEIDHDDLRDLGVALERDHGAFRATAGRARDVERRGLRRATRE